MTVVRETVLRADGSPASGRVSVVLAGTGGVPTVGYAADGTRVSASWATIDSDGLWSVELEPNADITPAGTVWRVGLVGVGLPVEPRYITVPESGPVEVADCLVDPPGAITPAALAALEARVAVIEANYIVDTQEEPDA